jgi:hypothetical protein
MGAQAKRRRRERADEKHRSFQGQARAVIKAVDRQIADLLPDPVTGTTARTIEPKPRRRRRRTTR